MAATLANLPPLIYTTLVTNLRLQLVLPHNPRDTMDATSFASLAQVPMNPGAAVGRSARHIESLDQLQQAQILDLPGRYRFVQPGIKTTEMNFKDPAHRSDQKLGTMITDKGVLHPWSLAKYTAAFFKISRSSLTRRSSALRRAISA